MKLMIPLYYHPTIKIFLDDDSAFNSSLALKLNSLPLEFFSDPLRALVHILNTEKKSLDKITHNMRSIKEQDFSGLLNFNLKNPNNINETSVIFVDYHMPEISGLEFLDKIKNIPAKKVLLTGEQDYRVGIEAFNNGLIDAYLRKDEQEFAHKLQTMLLEEEWQYFIDHSKSLLNSLESNCAHLKYEKFAELFKNIMKAEQIVAFCIFNAEGDFILFNDKNEKKYLIIRTASQLNELAITAREDNAEENTAAKLEQLEVVPFFGEVKNFWEIPARNWEPYLFQAQILECSDSIAWALIKGDKENEPSNQLEL